MEAILSLVGGFSSIAAGYWAYSLSQNDDKNVDILSKTIFIDCFDDLVKLGPPWPVLVAIRGQVDSHRPKLCEISEDKAVIHKLTEDIVYCRQNFADAKTDKRDPDISSSIWSPNFMNKQERIIKRQSFIQCEWFLKDSLTQNTSVRSNMESEPQSKFPLAVTVKVENAVEAVDLDRCLVNSTIFIPEDHGNLSSAVRALTSSITHDLVRLGVEKQESYLPVGAHVTVIGELHRTSNNVIPSPSQSDSSHCGHVSDIKDTAHMKNVSNFHKMNSNNNNNYNNNDDDEANSFQDPRSIDITSINSPSSNSPSSNNDHAINEISNNGSNDMANSITNDITRYLTQTAMDALSSDPSAFNPWRNLLLRIQGLGTAKARGIDKPVFETPPENLHDSHADAKDPFAVRGVEGEGGKAMGEAEGRKGQGRMEAECPGLRQLVGSGVRERVDSLRGHTATGGVTVTGTAMESPMTPSTAMEGSTTSSLVPGVDVATKEEREEEERDEEERDEEEREEEEKKEEENKEEHAKSGEEKILSEIEAAEANNAPSFSSSSSEEEENKGAAAAIAASEKGGRLGARIDDDDGDGTIKGGDIVIGRMAITRDSLQTGVADSETPEPPIVLGGRGEDPSLDKTTVPSQIPSPTLLPASVATRPTSHPPSQPLNNETLKARGSAAAAAAAAGLDQAKVRLASAASAAVASASARTSATLTRVSETTNWIQGGIQNVIQGGVERFNLGSFSPSNTSSSSSSLDSSSSSSPSASSSSSSSSS
eukprot:CAMPEP_0175059762 /NCGR_PEP_ID=MMETSP0052_2-20121109/12614_1 /TAXON_ID=51329 ORGANISM="Polytomella parva, Strain SAG 63-3" /NCGR_SAMPLE_ID=MMETSP0052_2 /ASSEMBLY_ACC=CAM_ASM_000194 /LENGTH=764 /DNA_ID=CAMNT_0016325351 /DNA_START=1 /DNA_END=2292 /DNA_ORIENTATION=-